MMEPFDLLLHEEAVVSLRYLRGHNRKAIRSFLSSLSSNPFFEADTNYEDLKGRVISKVRIENYVIEYIVDDPVREIKVINIQRIPHL